MQIKTIFRRSLCPKEASLQQYAHRAAKYPASGLAGCTPFSRRLIKGSDIRDVGRNLAAGDYPNVEQEPEDVCDESHRRIGGCSNQRRHCRLWLRLGGRTNSYSYSYSYSYFYAYSCAYAYSHAYSHAYAYSDSDSDSDSYSYSYSDSYSYAHTRNYQHLAQQRHGRRPGLYADAERLELCDRSSSNFQRKHGAD